MDAAEAKITAHIEQYIGPIAQLLRGSSEHIGVAHVAAVDSRPVHTLVSVGMSAAAMSVPAGEDAATRIELMITLPPRWRLDEQALLDPQWGWPVEMLRQLTRWPQENRWMSWGTAIPNGSPPQPYAPTTKLCGAVIAPSLIVPPAFYELKLPTHTVVFYGIIPLYDEELQLHAREGMRVLFERLVDADVNDLIEPRRKNAARKRWWVFG